MSDQQPPSSGLSRLRRRIIGREESRPISPEAIAIHERVDQLSELELRDVMTPRTDVDFLTTPVTPELIAEAIRDTGHSCFPVVNGDLDEVEGVLFVNDLFRSTTTKRAIGVSLPSAAEIAPCTVTERQDPPMSCSVPSARLITVDPKAATAAPCASDCVSSAIVL